MRKGIIIAALALAALLGLAPGARADKTWRPFNASGTNANPSIDTGGFRIAEVSISGASPDGTVTVYVAANATAARRQVAQYVTPGVVKTYMGTVGGTLWVELTGNTTGTVNVDVVLK